MTCQRPSLVWVQPDSAGNRRFLHFPTVGMRVAYGGWAGSPVDPARSNELPCQLPQAPVAFGDGDNDEWLVRHEG